MQLSRNGKIFSNFFSAFQKYKLNFEDFGEKDEAQRRFVSEIIDCKSGVT